MSSTSIKKMNMRLKINLLTGCLTVMAIATLFVSSCKKDKALQITMPSEVAHFTFKSSGKYALTSPEVTFKIPVGVSTVSSQDRIIHFTVSSPTGAEYGVQYTLNNASTIVIPAGKAVDSIEV